MEVAIEEAMHALEAANLLNQSALGNSPVDKHALDVAVEKYIDYFQLPQAALESDNTQPGTVGGKLKKVIVYLYSLAQKLFRFFFDYLTNKKIAAKRYVALAKNLIGRIDDYQAVSFASVEKIANKPLAAAICIDSVVPKDIVSQYLTILSNYSKQLNHTAIDESIALIKEAKVGDMDKTSKASVELYSVLKAGAEASYTLVSNAKDHPLFRSESNVNDYYIAGPYLGQMYSLIEISKEPDKDGKFYYRCVKKRDNSKPTRLNGMEALPVDNILAICRAAVKHCNNVSINSTTEARLQKILRDAKFLSTNEPTETSIVALRQFACVVKNSYATHLALSMDTTKVLLRYASESVSNYEKLKNS